MNAFSRVAHHRVARLLPVISLIVLCASCSDFWVSDNATATVAVSPTALILKTAAAGGGTPGDTANITASATTVGGVTTDETTAVTWTSSAPAVATVDATGLVTVVGTAADATSQITAKFGGQSATCNILTYTGTAPTTLVISFPTNVSPSVISPGQQFKVTATAALSGNANHDISSFVTWTSNTPSVATVDANGNVVVLTTATSGNSFTISATATFASGTAQGTSTTFTIPTII